MTLRISIDQGEVSGSASGEAGFDMDALGVHDLKLTIAYDSPHRLEFKLRQPHTSVPITWGSFLQFWDDAGGTSQSDPLFEGHVVEIQPGKDANEVEIVCLDPWFRANEVPVMDATWTDADTPDSTSVCRAVWNVTIDNDDDYAFTRNQGQTVGEIIETILDDQIAPLRKFNAAPASASAYDSSDTGGMTYQPQEKFVVDSECVCSAIERCLKQHYPGYRLMFVPGTRKLRMRDLRSAAATTLTLNSFTGTNDVLSLQLQRSMEARATAVKIYGPETLTSAIASTVDGSLTVDSTTQVILEIIGLSEIYGYNKWQVTDSTKRRMGRLLPTAVLVPVGEYYWVSVRSPTLQISYDGGSTWATIYYDHIDFLNGTVSLGSAYPYFYSSTGQQHVNGIQHFFPPNAVRLVYAYYDTPLSVRKPASSFEGTAFTDFGLKHEYKMYEEMLAVGYEYGTPVTTATRKAQYEILAQAILDERKDVAYSGGCVLDGLEYGWRTLYHRVNIAAVDEDGSGTTIGLESIGAWVTEVEYDFEEQTTTLTFNSDQLELLHVDVEEMKRRLKIRALQRQEIFRVTPIFRPFSSKFSFRENYGGNSAAKTGDRYGGFVAQELAGLNVSSQVLFGDAELGFEAPIFPG